MKELKREDNTFRTSAAYQCTMDAHKWSLWVITYANKYWRINFITALDWWNGYHLLTEWAKIYYNLQIMCWHVIGKWHFVPKKLPDSFRTSTRRSSYSQYIAHPRIQHSQSWSLPCNHCGTCKSHVCPGISSITRSELEMLVELHSTEHAEGAPICFGTKINNQMNVISGQLPLILH